MNCRPVAATEYDKVREVDDILDAIQLLADQKSLDSLPVYVTDDIDKMPYVPLEHGELGFLLNKMETLEAMMKGMQADLCTLLRNAPSTPGSTVHDAATGGGSLAATAGGIMQVSSVQTVTRGGAPGHLSTQGKPAVLALNVNKSVQQPTASATQMAARVVVTARKSAASALQAEQRKTYFSTTSVDSQDEVDYETAMSRRKKQKLRQRERRQRQLLQQPQHAGGNNSAAAVESTGPKPKLAKTVATHGHMQEGKARNQQLAIGRRTSKCTVAAAKPFKQVLCIDNVDLSVHEPELSAFVVSLGVRVYSCHEVTARQTAWQRKNLPTPDHRTFRLCINRGDTAMLLNPDKLPSDVTVSRWHFKHNKPADNAARAAGAGDMLTDKANDDETFVIDDITSDPIASGTPSKQ